MSQEQPTDTGPPALDYAAPARLPAVARAVYFIGSRFLLAVTLFLAAISVPHPWGIWYFGHRPQWLIAVDPAGLSVGPSDHPVLLGWIPLLVAKLAVLAIPVWTIRRWGARSPAGNMAASAA